MKKILLTVLVWILPTVLWGKQLSDKQYIFQRIDVREGLSYQVNCMTVSHRTGHAWMGTKNGIGRFDGYEQKKYLNCNIDQLVEDRNNNNLGTWQRRNFFCMMRSMIPFTGHVT